MKKNLTATFLIMSLMFVSGASIASAESTTTPPDIATLQAKVEMLMKLIETLKASIATQGTELKVMRSELQLTKKQLRMGDKGDDVRVLQETLATDPDIYPEGKITGVFGPLTARAVKRFQEKHDLDGVGEVGPKTMEKLNRFLREGGAGMSGKIPEGLLRHAGNTIMIRLGAQNDSGLKGMAIIRDNAEGMAVVRIEMKKRTMMATGSMMMKKDDDMDDSAMYEDVSISHPAHIHLGSCAVPGAVKYPLSSIVGGKSETVLTVSTKDVLAGLPLMINVHKSATELGVYVACGDIMASVMKHDSMMLKRDEHGMMKIMKKDDKEDMRGSDMMEKKNEDGRMMASTTASSSTTY